MTVFESLDELALRVGDELGRSDWVTIDQARIDDFARATGDVQWIHVDPVRAAAGPFGRTVAHGFLTLALLPQMSDSAFSVRGVRLGVNYGLNKVRFPAPVPVGSRLCGVFRLIGFERLAGGAQLVTEATLLCEGADKPVCVAEAIVRQYV